MFVEGKIDGWLSIELPELLSWASDNGIQLQNAIIGPSVLGGSGVFASKKTDINESFPLITIPPSMILSKSRIEELAKQDVHLQQVLDSVEDIDPDWRTVCPPLLCEVIILS
jgi:hypothetical protein